ncbi:MAG: alpha-L-fucosidase [Lachnospiraceae bacterium]|nr:alpha-L-fucosidase [Lachnospiraceae bacterium]
MLSEKDEKIKWFKEARIGLFVHWGLYAATEGYWQGKETVGIGEWIASKERIPRAEYEMFAEKMTCEKFDPAYWARLAKNAGIQYCVFTAKHHEGFAMYDTSFDDYSIVKRGAYGKDVTKAVVEAMREEGITPCLYYSHALDFHEPNAMGNTWDFHVPEVERDFRAYIDGKCKHQLRELLTNYGDIGMLWMDVPKGITEEMALDLKAYVKKYQPGCLVSGRLAYDHRLADFGCFGDNQIPAAKPNGCWETAATMNDTWGYKRDDHNFKSPKEIIELLCGLLAKGTNLLLNIGPKANGEIPEESIYILEELAEWYKVNAEAVNGTESSPFDCDFSFGGASCRDNAIYLYVYESRESIDIYGIENKVTGAMVLGGPELAYTQEDALHIDLRQVEFGKYVTVIKLLLDGEVTVRKGCCQQEKGQLILPAAAGSIIRREKTQAAGLLIGDDALEAENLNLAGCEDMGVNPAGIVENWRSEQNYLQWDFEVKEEGLYDVFLYTITQKYKEWKGGHKVHILCNGTGESKVITADKESTGANRKYFGETGSFLGSVNLAKGSQTLALYADQINMDDPVGLSVSKLTLIKR